MKTHLVIFFLLLSLTSAKEAVRSSNDNNNNNNYLPDRAAILQRLERSLEEKRQMARDHESGHRRLSDKDLSDVLRIIDHQTFQIQKYKALSDEDLFRSVNNNRKQPEAARAEETHTGPTGADDIRRLDDTRRRKAEEKRRAAEDEKARRIEDLDRLLLQRQDRLALHERGHRVLGSEQQVEDTKASIAKLKGKLEATKNTPAHVFLVRNSNNWNMQKRGAASRIVDPQTEKRKSSNLSFMEAMNAPLDGKDWNNRKVR